MTNSGFGHFSEYFDAFASNLVGPVPICLGRSEEMASEFLRSVSPKGHFGALKLLTYSYSGIRSAMMLAQGGATMNVPPILRTSLEAAGYARLFETSPEWAKTWRERHESKQAREKFRHEGHAAVKSAIEAEDSKLLQEYKDLYNLLIDFGAHPNVLGVESVINYQDIGNGDVNVSFIQLSGQRERAIACIQAIQVTLFLVGVMKTIWRSTASELAIEAKMSAIVEDMFSFAEAEGVETEV